MANVINSNPQYDGFKMPAEFEPQDNIYMIWPQREDIWHSGAKLAQETYKNVAKTISKYTPVTMIVNSDEFENAKEQLEPHGIKVIEIESDGAWARDIVGTFVVNGTRERRMVAWDFNAWGGEVDGLYYSWLKDQALKAKLCVIDEFDYYLTPGFVLEGGSFHVDGEGTLITTEECLLSKGRNPHLSKEQIEGYLQKFLNVEKVIWLDKGLDPEETNGHIDELAAFVRPGEVVCSWTDDKAHDFYDICQDAYKCLSEETDAKGRKLKVHKVPLPIEYIRITKEEAEGIKSIDGTLLREEGDICPASYVNFLVTNDGVIVPQFGDPNDKVAIEIFESLYPEKEVVGLDSREIVLGGGNIHCVTQQRPAGKSVK